MNHQYVLNSIATALVAATESFRASADAYTGDDDAKQPVPAAAPVAPTAIANAELDVDGLPWDARIHAGTKTKTQKGAWTQKKGVDDTVRAAVLAELHQMYPAAATASAPAPAPAAVGSAPTVALPTIAVPTAATPYSKFVDWLAKNTGAGKVLTDDWVKEVFAANRVELANLAKPELEATVTALHEAMRNALTGAGGTEVV